MTPAALRAALARLDPADWDLPLTPAGARAAWRACLDGLPDAVEPVDGRPPRRVGIVCSANVFVAPVEWVVQLRARGVEVWLKPARGQERAMRAIAHATGAEVRAWRGGVDLEIEAEALADADGLIAFGGAEAVAAVSAHARGRPCCGFGPRFGAAVVEAVDAALVDDLALHDSRGCMSPAAAFVDRVDLDAAARLLAEAEARCPRGRLDPAEAAAIRARITLARAVGEARTGEGWAALALPARHFQPVALPRVLVLHPAADALRALAPHLAHLGTLAVDRPLPLPGAGPSRRFPIRASAPGAMQRPPAERWHDGVDVLGTLWGAA